MKPFVSVVIPAYNEEKRIGGSLRKIIDYAKSKPFAIEILVSDDGSLDATAETAKKELEASGTAYQVIRAPLNRGKGAAVKAAMLQAKGDYRLFSDADLSTPIEELDRFLPLLIEKKADVVIGSRAVKGANIQERQPFFREWMGRVFNCVAAAFAFRGIKDSQCGFKCFSSEAAEKIFTAQKLDGFSFDVEIVFLAQKFGFQITELPVTWINSAATKVKIFTDPAKMFWDVLRIRRLHRDTK